MGRRADLRPLQVLECLAQRYPRALSGFREPLADPAWWRCEPPATKLPSSGRPALTSRGVPARQSALDIGAVNEAVDEAQLAHDPRREDEGIEFRLAHAVVEAVDR